MEKKIMETPMLFNPLNSKTTTRVVVTKADENNETQQCENSDIAN